MESHGDFKRITRKINGIEKDVIQVEAGGHLIEAVELDMADQWDFMEMAHGQLDNHAWVNTALLASAVISIDGAPLPIGKGTREGIRQVLRKIGASGLDALQAAFGVEESGAASSESVERAAGN